MEAVPGAEPAAHDLQRIERYLEHVRIEKRLAARTVELYALDLQKLMGFAQAAGIDLTAVRQPQVRRWAAQMHGAGRSGRGVALILSGWRGFYGWLARGGEVAGNPVQDVRAPKTGRPLPKALGVEEAVRLAAYQAEGRPTPGSRRATPAWSSCSTAAVCAWPNSPGSTGGPVPPHADGSMCRRRRCMCSARAASGARVPVGAPALAALCALAFDARAAARRAEQPRSSSAEAAAGCRANRSGSACAAAAAKPGLRHRCIRTCCGTRSRATCCSPAATCARCRSCSGHANITTTQVYTRLDFQHLARAYDAAHPRAKIGSLSKK